MGRRFPPSHSFFHGIIKSRPSHFFPINFKKKEEGWYNPEYFFILTVES